MRNEENLMKTRERYIENLSRQTALCDCNEELNEVYRERYRVAEGIKLDNRDYHESLQCAIAKKIITLKLHDSENSCEMGKIPPRAIDHFIVQGNVLTAHCSHCDAQVTVIIPTIKEEFQ